jgi:aspartate-semialdehyde dehydrogenase
MLNLDDEAARGTPACGSGIWSGFKKRGTDFMAKAFAVAGASGTVGREVLQALAEAGVAAAEVAALASDRSAGTGLTFGEDEEIVTQDIAAHDFASSKVTVFCTAAAVAAAQIPRVARGGGWAIDASAHSRLDPAVPLIVPGVNDTAEILDRADKRIVAYPSACVAMLARALKPLHDAAGCKRAVAATYQSVSEAGKDAMDELFGQTRNVYVNMPLERAHFAKQIAFNTIPHCGNFLDDGTTTEEAALAKETPRLLPGVKVAATCVRVPAFVGHGMAVTAEFEKPMGTAQARAMMKHMPGLAVVDHRHEHGIVTPLETQGEGDVFASRLRDDPSAPNLILFWLAADNLRGCLAQPIARIALALAEKG